MSRIQSIPTDIILKILDGESIEDIVALAQATSLCYETAKTIRSLWLNAHDTVDISILAGHTIHTIPVEYIFALALRCVHLRRKLDSSLCTPKHFHPLFRYVDSYWDNRLALMSIPGSRFVVVHIEDRLYVLEPFASLSDLTSLDPLLCTDGNIIGCDLETVGNGDVVLAVLYGSRSDGERRDVELISLSFSPDATSFTHNRVDRCTVSCAPVSIAIRSGLILSRTHSFSGFLLYAVDRRVGVKVTLDLPFDLIRFVLVSAKFVASIPKAALVLSVTYRTGESVVMTVLVDIPELPETSLESNFREPHILWTPVKLGMTHTYLHPYLHPSPTISPLVDVLPEDHIPVDFLIVSDTPGNQRQLVAIVFDIHEDALTGVALRPRGRGNTIFLEARQSVHSMPMYPLQIRQTSTLRFLDCAIFRFLNQSRTKILASHFVVPPEVYEFDQAFVRHVDGPNGRLYVEISQYANDNEARKPRNLFVIQY